MLNLSLLLNEKSFTVLWTNHTVNLKNVVKPYRLFPNSLVMTIKEQLLLNRASFWQLKEVPLLSILTRNLYSDFLP